MKPVDRSEILDLGAYEQVRERFRNRVIALKKLRRVALGDHLTMVFENHDTVLLQIQEMLRTERITNDAAIAHEIRTYNELLPGKHELSATLFVEYADPNQRKTMLETLHDLDAHIHLLIGDRKVAMKFSRQFGEEAGRLPAVNYARLQLSETDVTCLRETQLALWMESSHPAYQARTAISAQTRAQWIEDLSP